MFYARAIPLLAFFTAVLFLVMVGAGFAMAQEAGPVTVDQIAAPVAVPEGYTGLAGLADSLLTGFAASVAGVIALVLARLWNLIPEGVRAVIKHIQANTSLKDTTDTAAWHKMLMEVSDNGVVLAAAKLGLDPKSIQSWEEKNAFLKLAGAFAEKFDSDIKQLIDKDGDGVPDVVQVALAKIAPHTITIPKPAALGFMSEPAEPQPRGVKPSVMLDPKTLAAKYAPRKAKAGTVQ